MDDRRASLPIIEFYVDVLPMPNAKYNLLFRKHIHVPAHRDRMLSMLLKNGEILANARIVPRDMFLFRMKLRSLGILK